VSDYEGLIKGSDVCVSTASYHTSVMLIKHRKKAVLIPFEGQGLMSFHEQPARAALLRETIGAGILSIQGLTVKNLTAAIKSAGAGEQVRSQVPNEWFMGEKVLDKSLIGLFGH
jgi:predicted glycosyltransferase